MMAWARLDDRFHEHRKVRGLWRKTPAALGLHAMALTYCAGHETDGGVDAEFLLDKVPSTATRRKLCAALVDAEMWIDNGDGSYTIHDFLKYHPSHAEAENKRSKDAERKAKGRGTQAGLRADSSDPGTQTPFGVHEESARTPDGIQAESSGPVPSRPDPTMKDPLTPKGDLSVKVNRKSVPRSTVEHGRRLLAVFNESAGTSIGERTGQGGVSNALRRFIAALVDHPDVPVEQWERGIRAQIANPPSWVEGGRIRDVGPILGPNAVQRTIDLGSGLRAVGDGSEREMTTAEAMAIRARVYGQAS